MPFWNKERKGSNIKGYSINDTRFPETNRREVIIGENKRVIIELEDKSPSSKTAAHRRCVNCTHYLASDTGGEYRTKCTGISVDTGSAVIRQTEPSAWANVTTRNRVAMRAQCQITADELK
jgi:hypothetical protein